MPLDRFADFAILAIFLILVVVFAAPPLVLFWLRRLDRRQHQHAVLRNFPLLGRLRYLFEHVGPELRQYLFDADRGGKPFSRDDYRAVVFAAKYADTMVSFGTKRDYEAPGWFLRNALFPTLEANVEVVREPRVRSRRYRISDEGLFAREERLEEFERPPHTLPDAWALRLGEGLPQPWELRGLVGMSAMSYGSLGRHAIQALSHGLAVAGATWMNTGEGGLSPHHLVGGGDVVFQIGPGLFGVRTQAGEWDWDEFRRKAETGPVRGIELKFHQGAKIRGGHLEGAKVTEEIAGIRRVQAGRTIDSPNRFPMFDSVDGMLDWVARMRETGGKPVGVKLVMGGPGAADELAAAMARRGDGPDWITVDGGEGGSGAAYQELADAVGVPVLSGIVVADDALRRHGVRERVRLFASGKLITPDRVALALSLGADAANIARGMMISVGCIQAQRCHTNRCPVGVATTDEELMRALVVEEKQWRVANYVLTLRAGLTSLTAAAGLLSPRQFGREHAVFKDAHGRIHSAEELFPSPERQAA
jgi:glutamate synthase domain-containing protein 2